MPSIHKPIFRQDKGYVIVKGNDFYIKPPQIGLWVVYMLKLGEYVYYGSTNAFEQRMGQHLTRMRLIKKTRKSHKLFTIEIVKHHPIFEIVCFCDNKAEAGRIEREYIKKPSKEYSLNTKSR